MHTVLIVLVMSAVLGILWGGLQVMAGAMSDDPQSGNDDVNSGCVTVIASLVVAVVCMVALAFRV
jgi:hypothetical protein